MIKLCFSSDFFIEEADEWRNGCWELIRRRSDCIFVTTTKRPERIRKCLPPDWGSAFMRNGVNIGKWNLKDQIALAERIQHESEETY